MSVAIHTLPLRLHGWWTDTLTVGLNNMSSTPCIYECLTSNLG